jgi:hypothetical protein
MIDENDELLDISGLVNIQFTPKPLPKTTKYSNKFLFGDPSKEYFVRAEIECDGRLYKKLEARDEGDLE